ncbi:MAG: hypothetical protein ACOCUW_00930 [Gemmatimonadota bacterium]
MPRTIQDDDLLLWEVYAAAPRAAKGRGARIVFHCLSDPERRARVTENDADRTATEKWIAGASDAELRKLLDAAERLD